MSTQLDSAEFYHKNGFGLFREIFSPEEVNNFRNESARIFDSEPKNPQWDSNSVRPDPFERYPELRKIFANGKLLKALRAILGDDCRMLWGGSIHDSSVKGGWHKDTNALENAGYKFHFSPDFHLVTVAVYLQDNRPDFGGGLDIIPGSQKRRETRWEKTRASNRKIKFILSHLDRRGLLPSWVLHKRKGAMPIPSRAGDVLFFNMKCDHRPTHAFAAKIPEEHRKFAIFFSFSANNEALTRYVDFLKTVTPAGMPGKYSENTLRELKGYGLQLVELT